MDSIYFKNLKFRDRKVVHYTLLVCIILLQIIAIALWYNETANENKISNALDDIATANEISNANSKINDAILQSQQRFNHYIENRDQTSLDQYLALLKETTTVINGLQLSTKNSTAFKALLSKRNKIQTGVVLLKSTIDSILNKQLYPNASDGVSPFKFEALNYTKILDSINTNTYIKVDNIAKKGLLTRLIAAFSGKVQIQKEQLNTVVTMQYKDKVITGTIEELLKNVILNTNKHYALEFKKLNNSFLNLRKKDLQLIQFNNELLLLCNKVLPDYTAAANAFKTESQQKAKAQYKTNRAIRSCAIVMLILLMFVISIILFNFTRMAFEYEQKLVAAQDKIRQSLNFKNRIMGMISHEIRSPLSILSIYSRKISGNVADKNIKEAFQSIQFTTDSLLLLSNQILEYSKDEQQPMVLKNSDFNLNREIHKIITTLTSLVENKGNKIVLHSNLNPENEVCADAAKIHQLLYNIVGNANKFTENGLISIDLRLEELSDFEYNLNVTIADNGIGISEHDLVHIFEAYYQGTVSEKVNDLGIGLGLNLCKEIVTLFDGNISIESKENMGTKVKFNLILSKI